MKYLYGSLFALLPTLVLASNIDYKAVQNTEMVKTNVVDLSEKGADGDVGFLINGMKMTLTQEDKVRARNWGLSDSEWARYLYLKSYTPRGQYTPDLDPILMLGNEARSSQERQRFARKALDMYKRRTVAELSFSLAVDELSKADESGKSNKADLKGPVSSRLPEGKTTLTSVFLPTVQCLNDASCVDWASNLVAINSVYNQLDIFFAGGTDEQVAQLTADLGVSQSKIDQADISLRRERGESSKVAPGRALPFAIYRSDMTTDFVSPDEN